jgi:hypothetical protein
MDLKLTLTLDETNLILEALGNLPFARVYTLINAIQAQASGQLTPPETKPVNEQPTAGQSPAPPVE